MKKTYLIILIAVIVLAIAAAGWFFLRGKEMQDSEKPAETEVIQSPTETEDKPLEKEKELFKFTRENLPRLNGSTSTVPLAQAICSVLLGERRDDVADLTEFSKTTESYYALINGETDLLIAAEPAREVVDYAEWSEFEWKMEPFAIEGLVFIVNENNPVDSLTVEQVQKIYTGEITNWKQVGGDDLEIKAFQRNETSGSQTMMKKLVMGALEMKETETQYVVSEMSGLIEAVRGYDNSAEAIGYTVYYYANDMKMADGMKILAINGVTPGNESFRSGEYPFLNPYYVVMAADEPEDSPTAILFSWILSDEGQRLVDNEGYVAVKEVVSE